MVNYYRVKAAEAMELGIQFAEKGNYQQGQQLIENVMLDIKNNKNIK